VAFEQQDELHQCHCYILEVSCLHSLLYLVTTLAQT
jgi:hypothetical protein